MWKEYWAAKKKKNLRSVSMIVPSSFSLNPNANQCLMVATVTDKCQSSIRGRGNKYGEREILGPFDEDVHLAASA